MKNYYKAISNFQRECPILPKKSKGYGYNYCKLETMIPIINPILNKNGLSYTQPLSTNPLTNKRAIKTTVFHNESGEFETEYWDFPEVDLKGQNRYQSDGSGITYYRRYALASHLGIVSDEDNDASGKQRDSRPWLTKRQFDAAMEGTIEQAQNVLKGFQMDSEYKNNLTSKFKI